MKKFLKSTILTLLITLCLSVNVFAAGLVTDDAGLHYQTDDGTNITNTWVEIFSYWYQFDVNGNCVDPTGSKSYTLSEEYNSVMFTSYILFNYENESTAQSYVDQGLAIKSDGKYYLTPEFATEYVNKQIAASAKITEKQATTTTTTEEQAVTKPTEASEEEVQYCWRTATGSKYHSINNCGKTNPKNTKQITIEEAESLGLTPCSKCY